MTNPYGGDHTWIPPNPIYVPEALGEDDETDVTELNHPQEARVQALYHARELLERRGGIAAPSTPPSMDDMIYLARWIIVGTLLDD